MSFSDVLKQTINPDAPTLPAQERRPWDERTPGPKLDVVRPETDIPQVLQADDEDAAPDWSALVDPRRDIVDPEHNPFTDLSPRHIWIKKEMAEGSKLRDQTDYYFKGDNLDLSPREIYEREMGIAMADKAADEIQGQQNAQQSQFFGDLAAAGVHGMTAHPVLGTPVFTDAQGNPIDPATMQGGRVQVGPDGQPYDVASGQGAVQQPGSIGGAASPDSGQQASPEEVGKSVVSLLQTLGQYDDPHTRAAMDSLQRYAATYPTSPEPAPLHGPNLVQSLLTVVAAGVMPPHLAMQVLSMPFVAGLHRQEVENQQNQQTYANKVHAWQAGLKARESGVEAAQTEDKANYDAKKFDVDQHNDAVRQEANREDAQTFKEEEAEKARVAKAAHDKETTGRQTRLRVMSMLGKVIDSPRYTEEQRQNAARTYAELAGMSDGDIQAASQGSEYFQKLEADVRKKVADADVAERTADSKVDKAQYDSENAKKRGLVLDKTLHWYDAKAQADIRSKQMGIADKADSIRSRGLRDRLALDKDSRDKVQDQYKAGVDELKRITDLAEAARKDQHEAEGELYGNTKSNQSKGGGGLLKQISDLKSRTNLSPTEKKRLEALETRRTDLENRIKDDQKAIADNGKLYNATAEDVKTLRGALSIEPLGDKDDRKVDAGGYMYDLGGKYVFGAKGEAEKDCSGLVQHAMKSGGVKDFPGSCQEQLAYLRGAKGKKAGFKDVLADINSGKDSLQEGDLLYLPGSPPPKGSGYHVKVFAGWHDETPVWMEAKGTSSGVGTFKDQVKGKKIFGLYRPPKKD